MDSCKWNDDMKSKAKNIVEFEKWKISTRTRQEMR